MRIIVLIILLIIFSIACSPKEKVQSDSINTAPDSMKNLSADKTENNVNKSQESKDASDKKEIDDNDKKPISIKNNLGLISLSDRYPESDDKKDKTDFIKFYNADGSLWYEFTFYYDDSDGKFEYKNDNFRAFAFHPDHFLLSVRCVGEDKDRYQVIVNEETGLKKYVSKNEKNLMLESFGKHLLKTFSIDLEKEKNKIFETRNGKELKLDFEKIDRFEAVEVKGDWLKVKWELPDRKEEYKSGWVRWKENEIILIDWFYFA
jgi:hypothetical protein